MNDRTALLEKLKSLGAAEASIRWLDRANAHNIAYLDLLDAHSKQSTSSEGVYLSAVVEFERQPLLYAVETHLLSGNSSTRQAQISKTLRTLTWRGDPAYLAVLDPGQVTLYPVGLTQQNSGGVEWRQPANKSRSLIQELIADAVPGLPGSDIRRLVVHDLLFTLLYKASDCLRATRALRGDDDGILALTGRALFARFLIDRKIMTPDTFSTLNANLEDCFSNAKLAAKTCKWLDDQFNGELLPLAGGRYRAAFDAFGADATAIFHVLSNILHRSPDGQITFDAEWADLDFAHVPIGLLSEVYERYAHRHVGHLAKPESIHYTPRHIAEFMVQQAFDGLEPGRRAHARILDGSAGGGVFLILCLRKLVAERWHAYDRRPSRKEIRNILYRQIRGFDINSSALKLAALGLYLTALELDPDPTEPDGLQFAPLFALQANASSESVLTHARFPNEQHPNPGVLGSLGPAIPDFHKVQYDIVIGNPPWTGISHTSVADKFHGIVRGIARNRAGTDSKYSALEEISRGYENPDGVPDLPFAWCAMEWAKESGIIALALHARLLFKQSDRGIAARNALFSAVRVTGVLNGAAVRKENVWPNVNAPWCLLFAKNEIPKDHDAFRFINVELEKGLNKHGRVRIDYKNAQPVQLSVLKSKPHILKTLFRGGAMDAAVLDHLATLETVPWDGYMQRHGLKSGKGYQNTQGGKANAKEFAGMPDLRREWAPKFAVNVTDLKPFREKLLHRTRRREIYRAPLMLLPEALPSDREMGCGLIALEDVFYSVSFNGYSTYGFKSGNPQMLARYLHVLSYSQLFRYYFLMAGTKFGTERDVVEKDDIDDFPLIPFESISQAAVSRIREISISIAEGKCPWSDVDNLVFSLYGMSEEYRQTVADTLSVSLPYTATQSKANAAPTKAQIEIFTDVLQRQLRPFFALAKVSIEVRARPNASGAWQFVDVLCNGAKAPQWDQEWVRAMADDEGASCIFVKNPPHHLGIALLGQYRYWTKSRAQMCALTIIREHSNELLLDFA